MMINDPAQYFYVCNGSVLKDMGEMLNELSIMDETSFIHHVNPEKNDFSNWTQDILKDGWLAKKLSSAKTREEMANAIKQRLKAADKAKNKKSKKAIISQIKETIANG